MRMIKTYEKYTMKNKKNYWLIPMDYRLHVGLLKVGASDSFMKEMLSFREMNKKLNNEPFVYVGCDFSNEKHIWKWSPYDNKLGKDVFEKDNYIFKGEVEVTDDDIIALKHITG